MNDREERLNRLKKSWEITTRHLEAARGFLPSPLVEWPQVEAGSVRRFEDYLRQNELGLALDELEALGEANSCPPEFWHQLIAAAKNMESMQQELRCRRRAREAAT